MIDDYSYSRYHHYYDYYPVVQASKQVEDRVLTACQDFSKRQKDLIAASEEDPTNTLKRRREISSTCGGVNSRLQKMGLRAMNDYAIHLGGRGGPTRGEHV